MISTFKITYRISLITLLSIVFFVGCSTTHKLTVKKAGPKNKQEEKNAKITASFIKNVNLSQYRSHLSDVYSTMENKVPEAFKPLPSQKEHVISNNGYRVQIVSTGEKNKAEKLLHNFNDWIFQQNDIPYKAMAYIIFKQPFYRVQIGDFTNKEKAIDYSRKLKRKYPGAWVVQTKINPDNTPEKMEKTQQQNQGNGSKQDSVDSKQGSINN